MLSIATYQHLNAIASSDQRPSTEPWFQILLGQWLTQWNMNISVSERQWLQCETGYEKEGSGMVWLFSHFPIIYVMRFDHVCKMLVFEVSGRGPTWSNHSLTTTKLQRSMWAAKCIILALLLSSPVETSSSKQRNARNITWAWSGMVVWQGAMQHSDKKKGVCWYGKLRFNDGSTSWLSTSSGSIGQRNAHTQAWKCANTLACQL